MEREPIVRFDRIRQEMDEKGWGNGELAAYSGVVYDTVYKTMKDERQGVTALTLAQMAKAFNVSLEYLLGLSDTRKTVFYDIDATARQLIELSKGLSENRRLDLLATARMYISEDKSREDKIGRMLDSVRLHGGEEEYERLLELLSGLPGDDAVQPPKSDK
jgi:transcriptional regulator with XRE-family HTH domain